MAERLDFRPEVVRVRGGPGKVEEAALAELARDLLIVDQLLDQSVGVERLAIERAARVVAVALEQLGRAPLVARVHDSAIPGRPAEPELLGLEERDGGARPGEHPGGVDPGVPAADDDDIRDVRQRSVPAGRKLRHRGVPVGPPLVVAIEGRAGGRR